VSANHYHAEAIREYQLADVRYRFFTLSSVRRWPHLTNPYPICGRPLRTFQKLKPGRQRDVTVMVAIGDDGGRVVAQK